jgi:hypothetical protein
MHKPDCLRGPIGLFLPLCAAVLFGSCKSTLTTVSPAPPARYEKLGAAEGKATGSLGVLGTAYYVIPIGLNTRTERAYERAVASVPGATGLIDVTIKEDWLWWLIGTAWTTTITGEAIKETN